MAYYFLFPEKDATIYSHPDRKGMNTGHDEILEIVKEKGSSDSLYYPSRVLIKFKDEEIQNRICYLHKKKLDKVVITITDVEVEDQYGFTTDRF